MLYIIEVFVICLQSTVLSQYTHINLYFQHQNTSGQSQNMVFGAGANGASTLSQTKAEDQPPNVCVCFILYVVGSDF